MKKLFVETYGCQMNVRDSEEVTGLLLERGYTLTDSEDKADVILYNTCSVRERAEHRVWSNVGALKELKRLRSHVVIGLMGCMARAQRETIFKRMPHVDFISGPAQIYEVPELIEQILEERRPMAAIQEKRRPEFQQISYHAGKVTALVTIMEGCDKVCSYCIVPYTRGPEVSRRPEEVIREVEELVRRGYKEVALLGQNVNSYGRRFHDEPLGVARGATFPGLLQKVNEVAGVERIRFITSHPWDAVEELFAAMRDLPRVCEHLHLPVQSGSDPILEKMRRGYTAKEYLKKVDHLRRMVPGVSITTDLIAGFPGETDADFKATLALVKEAQFDSAFIFSYSPRPFAAASRWQDDVPQEVKKERLQILLGFQEEISRRKDEAFVGRDVEVLVEEKGEGRSRGNRKVHFEGLAEAGGLVDVHVERVRGHSLVGKVVSAAFLFITFCSASPVVFAADELSALEAAFLRGEYAEVAHSAGSIAQGSNPSGAELALYLKGVSELKLRDLDSARGTLSQLLAEFPHGKFVPQAQIALGDIENLSGNTEKAASIFEALARDEKAQPLFPQIAFRLGDAQRRLGLWEEAKKTLQELTLRYPNSQEALQAKNLLAGGDFAFCVQVGAFESKENARRLETELKRRQFAAEVNDVILGGKRFYRVRVGRFKKREEAASEMKRLRQEGFPGKIVP